MEKKAFQRFFKKTSLSHCGSLEKFGDNKSQNTRLVHSVNRYWTALYQAQGTKQFPGNQLFCDGN